MLTLEQCFLDPIKKSENFDKKQRSDFLYLWPNLD